MSRNKRMLNEANEYLCDAFHQLTYHSSEHIQLQFPKDIGTGHIRQMESKQGLAISNWCMNFNSDVEVHGMNDEQYIKFGFCMKNGITWEIPKTGKKLEINKGQFFISKGGSFEEHTCYEKGVDFEFIGIKIPINYFYRSVQENFESKDIELIELVTKSFTKNEISPPMMRVLAKLSTFHYEGGIGSMFLEGNFLELCALYFRMIFDRNNCSLSSLTFSKTDVDAIKDAKRIIDSQIINAPSCEELSRFVHINTSKLCKGFKHLFGRTIHSYIIDRRLEIAALMLMKGTHNVGQIGAFVGYSNMSHFSAAFRKKYGINPKEFQKSYCR